MDVRPSGVEYVGPWCYLYLCFTPAKNEEINCFFKMAKHDHLSISRPMSYW